MRSIRNFDTPFLSSAQNCLQISVGSLRGSGLKIDPKFWRQTIKQASNQTPRVNIKDLKTTLSSTKISNMLITILNQI